MAIRLVHGKVALPWKRWSWCDALSCCSRRTSHRPPSEPSLRIRTSSSWTSPATWPSSRAIAAPALPGRDVRGRMGERKACLFLLLHFAAHHEPRVLQAVPLPGLRNLGALGPCQDPGSSFGGGHSLRPTARGRRNFQSVVAIEKEYLAIVLGWAPDTMHLDAPSGAGSRVRLQNASREIISNGRSGSDRWWWHWPRGG